MMLMIGIDTNILFYSIDNSDETKHQISLKIIEDLFQHPDNYKVSLQVLAELNSSIRRKNNKAMNLASELSMTILKLKECIISYKEDEFKLALNEPHLFDALIAHTYASAGCTRIITENLKHMPKIKGVKFVDPFRK